MKQPSLMVLGGEHRNCLGIVRDLGARGIPLLVGASSRLGRSILMDAGKRLLKGMSYHGVAHLDFRRDQRDGKPRLIDFNVRLAGTNQLSVESGVNFPLMLFQLALGESLDPCFEYRTDIEYRWWLFGEVLHFLQSPRKLSVARQLLRRNGVCSDLRPTDPLPIIAHFLFTLRQRYSQL